MKIDLDRYIIRMEVGYLGPAIEVSIREYGSTGVGSAHVYGSLDDAYEEAVYKAEQDQLEINQMEVKRSLAMKRQRELSLLGIDWNGGKV